MKLIFCTLALTTLLLSGCSQGDTENNNSSVAQNTTTGQASPSSQQPVGTVTDMISEEEAMRIALSHAELTTEQATFTQSDIDRDNGRTNYDMEFYTQDNKEYHYEIDAYTGDILEWDVENRDRDIF